MDGQLAAAVFTDPPYNVPIDGYVTGFGNVHHAEFAMASGEMTEAEFIEFLFQDLRKSYSRECAEAPFTSYVSTGDT